MEKKKNAFSIFQQNIMKKIESWQNLAIIKPTPL